jgi:hypothetical protein
MIGSLDGLPGVEIQERLDEPLALSEQVRTLVVVARVAPDRQAAPPEPDVDDSNGQRDERGRYQSDRESPLDGGTVVKTPLPR